MTPMKIWARTLGLVLLAGAVGIAQQAAPKAPATRPTVARQLPTAAPESVGVSSERLEGDCTRACKPSSIAMKPVASSR